MHDVAYVFLCLFIVLYLQNILFYLGLVKLTNKLWDFWAKVGERWWCLLCQFLQILFGLNTWNPHIMVREWNMNVFVETTLWFWFFFLCNWIKGLFLIFFFFLSLWFNLFCFSFVLTHWSMWRVECRFFTLVSLRTWEGNLSLHSRKGKGFYCLLMSPSENWTPGYI